MTDQPKRTPSLGGYLSSREVGEWLGIPERTIRAKWRDWGLQAYRFGKHLRWHERDVRAWLQQQKEK